MSFILIQALVKQKPDLKVTVTVPTSNLRDQWYAYVVKYGLLNNVHIYVINTASKMKIKTDLWICDESHSSFCESFIKVYKNIDCQMFLGLTATIERADEREKLITSVIPIIDTITTEEALQNNWLSRYRKYLVLLDIDLTQYMNANVEFYEGFEFFGRDFHLAMSMKDFRTRYQYARQLVGSNNQQEISKMLKTIIIMKGKFNRGLQKRKAFIGNHPKKIELANKILEARSDKKCIVFCHTIKQAGEINAITYSGQDTGKKGKEKLDEFINSESGAIASSKKLIAGFDDPSISVMIDLDINSSKIRHVQSVGRTIRATDENKEAEIFILVLRNTVEEQWAMRSRSDNNYFTIDEDNLIKVLNGEEFNVKKNKEVQSQYWQ